MNHAATIGLIPVNVRQDKPAFALQNENKLFLSATYKGFVYSPYDACVFDSFAHALRFAATLSEHLRQKEFLDEQVGAMLQPELQ
jgi:hypothetical protein